MQFFKPLPTLLVGAAIGYFLVPRIMAKIGS
jgi:uncharacterized protein YneF (UPF0154 family)